MQVVYYRQRQRQGMDENLLWQMGHRCGVAGGPAVDVGMNIL